MTAHHNNQTHAANLKGCCSPAPGSGPSQAQLFGPLSIYNHQQESEQLARDLSKLFFDNTEEIGVLLVLRDGCYEDSPPKSGEQRFRRYYHPSYLKRYGFELGPDETKRSVVDWINAFCRENDISPPASEDWRQLVEHVGGSQDAARWREWNQPQRKEEAFEKLASIFSRVNYTGVTPGRLDDLIEGLDLPEIGSSYPVFHIVDSRRGENAWIRVACTDLLATEPPSAPGETYQLAGFSFYDAPDDPNEVLQRLFRNFLDPFFAGGTMRSSEEDGEESSGFTGVALPLFQRWEKGPTGAFVGWVFLSFRAPENRSAFLKSLKGNSENSPRHSEVLRALLNSYASSLSEHIAEEEVRGYEPSNTDPKEFLRARFHHIEGWTIEYVESDALEDEDYYQLPDVSKKLSIRLGTHREVCATLTPKSDTILPDRCAGAPDCYYYCVANRARTFFEDLSHLHSEYLAGRMRVSHSIPYTISVHLNRLKQLSEAIRKMNEAYPSSAWKDVPDVIRRFRYPVELYSLAIENALLQKPDGKAFRSLVPVVAWIDDILDNTGLCESTICLLADQMARPLAQISLNRADEPRVTSSLPLKVSGSIESHKLKSRHPFGGRILVAALIELLREAFHHCVGTPPIVYVTLNGGAELSINVTNTCNVESVPAWLKAGNQSAILTQFASHLSSWKIEPPVCENGVWSRTIRGVANDQRA